MGTLAVLLVALGLASGTSQGPQPAAIRGPVADGQMERLLADANGAPVRAWVLFADKGIRTSEQFRAAATAAQAALSERTIRRRELRRTSPGLVDERDFALNESYVARVLATGSKLRARSRWANGISVWADAAQVGAIARLPFVRRITPVRRSLALGCLAAAPTGVLTLDSFYSRTYNQLRQLNVVKAHSQGHTGQGVVIGILDTGFNRVHEAFYDPDRPLVVLGEYDFVDDDPNTAPETGDPPGQHTHGTMILSTIGGYLPNAFVGGAYDASFLLAKTEDISQEVPAEEDYYVMGLEWIEQNGGDVATSSLGYIDWYSQSDLDGQTAVTTIGVNTATDNGLLCFTAAGNEGHDSDPGTSHLIAPADAMKVITCGAATSTGGMASFSSDGPTADGRLKPELVARGVDVAAIDPNSTTAYTSASGTSLSTPLLASCGAVLLSARPQWTVEQARAALFATGGDGSPDPLFVRGYGIANVAAAIEQQPVSFQFSYPRGRPTALRPELGTVFEVELSASGGDIPAPGTARVHYSLNGGPWVSKRLPQIAPNYYQAALPPAGCGSVIRYFFSARDADNLVASDPPAAPDEVFWGAWGSAVFIDEFDTDLGWTVENESLTGGAWVRVSPVGTEDDGIAAQPDEDSPLDPGALCYVTGQGSGGSIGEADVDGGPTRLVSPVVDLAGCDGTVSFSAWVYNDDHDEQLVVEVSNDGGSTWHEAMRIGHRPVWATYGFFVGSVVTPSAQVRLRFSIADNPNNSITEAAVDDVRVSRIGCDLGTATPDGL
jgi:serine protease AprX